jgi:hypothetical protein
MRGVGWVGRVILSKVWSPKVMVVRVGLSWS